MAWVVYEVVRCLFGAILVSVLVTAAIALKGHFRPSFALERLLLHFASEFYYRNTTPFTSVCLVTEEPAGARASPVGGRTRSVIGHRSYRCIMLADKAPQTLTVVKALQ